MSPRRSRIPVGFVISDLKHDLLDDRPAEIAPGVFLPATKRRAEVRVGEYRLTVEVSIQDGQPRCDLLTVESAVGAPITAKALRELPVATILEHIILGVFGSPFRMEGEARIEISTQGAVDARVERIPRRVLLPRVAEEYRNAMADPTTSRSPILAVAKKLGNYEPKYISKLVSEARKAGLLGPARPGVAGEAITKVERTR